MSHLPGSWSSGHHQLDWFHNVSYNWLYVLSIRQSLAMFQCPEFVGVLSRCLVFVFNVSPAIQSGTSWCFCPCCFCSGVIMLLCSWWPCSWWRKPRDGRNAFRLHVNSWNSTYIARWYQDLHQRVQTFTMFVCERCLSYYMILHCPCKSN